MGLPRSSLVKPSSTAPASPSTSVDVDLSFADTAADLPQAPPQGDEEHEHEASMHDLLERAKSLPPARPTLESIVLPNDPVLKEKMLPHAAQRRARFQKVVKATLGACVALCVAAIAATALSGEASASPSEDRAMARTAPATAVVPVEKLDSATRAKASPTHAAPSPTNARATLSKRH